jgi:signal peptidase II
MFRSPKVNKYFLSGIIISAVVIIDQVTKFLVQANLPLNKSIVVLDGFFNITYIRNTGGAFGILSGMSSPFFLISSSIALLIVVFYLVKAPKDNIWLIVSLSLISGGAIGNMIDRIRFGEVIDFIDTFYKNYHWPVFNIADSSITIGVFILFLDMIFSRKSTTYREK